jgi:iron complex transport system substrate-binding protein
LVVQGGVAKGLPALERLTAQGVAVALFDPRDFAGLFGVISRLGTITNREQQAAALVAAMEAKLAEVARRVAGKPRLSVFFEVRYPNLLAAGQDNLVSDIIAKAGGVNALEHPKKLVPYSLEALLQVNPEVYIIQRGPMNKSPEDIFRRPNFQELRAVKNRRVFLVEEDLFSRPGPRSAEAVARLADLLHGEIRGETAP